MYKKKLSILLSLLIVLTTIMSSGFATPTVTSTPAPTTPYISETVLTELAETMWTFTGKSKQMLIDTIDTYYAMSEGERANFFEVYIKALAAMTGQSYESLESFGLTGKFVNALNFSMDINQSTTIIDAYRSTSYQTFLTAILERTHEFEGLYTEEEIIKLIQGFKRLKKNIDIFVNADLYCYKRLLGYNTGSKRFESIATCKIEQIVSFSVWRTKGNPIYARSIYRALYRLAVYHNGLSGNDRALVLNHLDRNGVVFKFRYRYSSLPTQQYTNIHTPVALFASLTTDLGGMGRADALTTPPAEETTEPTPESLEVERLQAELDSQTIDITAVEFEGDIAHEFEAGGLVTLSATNYYDTYYAYKEAVQKLETVQAAVATKTPVKTPVKALVAIAITDMTESHWAAKEIAKFVNQGIAKVSEEGAFKPEEKITRYEVAVLIAKLLGLEATDDKMAFDDIATGWEDYAYLKATFNNGYMLGDGIRFRPHDLISREEFATIIGRILENNKIVLADTTALGFADATNVREWAMKGSKLVVQEGIIKGKPGNLFAPQDNTTKAEAILMLHRVSAKVPTKLED